MALENKPEVWQRGPVGGIPPLLQPVAHALLQAQEEIHEILDDFDEKLLWDQPAALASPAFHVQHITGVVDRLFTYARGEQLKQAQLTALSNEGKKMEDLNIQKILAALDFQIGQAIFQLRETDGEKLLEARGIGRKKIPTNVAGLLFHAAEHTMRHTGQLLVTTEVVRQAASF